MYVIINLIISWKGNSISLGISVGWTISARLNRLGYIWNDQRHRY